MQELIGTDLGFSQHMVDSLSKQKPWSVPEVP